MFVFNFIYLKSMLWGLPWWCSGSNAGGPGSIPGQGTRSHMHAATESSHATAKEPANRS